MQSLPKVLNVVFFFLLGALSTTLIVISLSYIFLTLYFQNRIYPGVKINNIDVSQKTAQEVIEIFNQQQYGNINNLTIQFSFADSTESATISATSQELNLHPDTNLMTSRAFSIGRQTTNPYYNSLQVFAAWQGQINLPLEISLDRSALNQKLDALAPQIEKPAINAVYQFDPTAGPDGQGRVKNFSPSTSGLALDREKIAQEIINQAKNYLTSNQPLATNKLTIPLSTKILTPEIQTSSADQMGIKTLLGEGVSYFYDSIPTRVYNISLGTSKVSGKIIAPGETFSFDSSIGTISAYFGFQKAYSIIQGKTVLDDGGGVCQVSTTIYRAVLNAGLPVLARTAHAYRVGFYEEGGFLPGMDATVYPPNPDFKFKNDTGNYILLQAIFDQVNHKLTFDIFGTDDGRKTTLGGPYILSTTPPPDPITEDDPTLPVGQTKQVDTVHFGANVYFTRKVVRGDQVLINETVKSNYIPWPARFLKGTKI